MGSRLGPPSASEKAVGAYDSMLYAALVVLGDGDYEQGREAVLQMAVKREERAAR